MKVCEEDSVTCRDSEATPRGITVDVNRENVGNVPLGSTWFATLTEKNLFEDTALTLFDEKDFKPTPQMLKLLRKHMLLEEYPKLDDIVFDDECTLAEGSANNTKTKFYDTGYFLKKTNRLTSEFRKKYLEMAYDKFVESGATVVSVHESTHSGIIRVSVTLRYEQILQALKVNRNVVFEMPRNVPVSKKVDYLSDYVQYVEISTNSVPSHIPHILKYGYKCLKCGELHSYPVLGSGAFKCDKINRDTKAACGGKLNRFPIDDLVMDMYFTPIRLDNTNVSLLSVKPIPPGDSTIAVVIRRDSVKAGYYGLVVGIAEKEYTTTEVKVVENQHMGWELVDHMDNVLLERVGYTIPGAEYQKMAILLSMFSNVRGYKSLNCMFIGRSGTNKSRVVSHYLPIIAKNCKVKDALKVSGAALVGSAVPVTINGQVVKTAEAGLLATLDALGIDEGYSNEEMFESLKAQIGSSTVTKSVSGNEINDIKTATVFFTANISSEHLLRNQKQLHDLYRMAKEAPDRFKSAGMFAETIYETYIVTKDYESMAKEYMRYYFKISRTNFIDGMDISHLERFGFLFYIGEEGKSDASKNRLEDFDFHEDEIVVNKSDELLFSPSLYSYLKYCAKFKPKIPQGMKRLLGKVKDEVMMYDFIHTSERLNTHLQRLAMLSAALNQRSEVNEYDVLFVKDFWSRTSRIVEPEQLIRSNFWKGYIHPDDVMSYLDLKIGIGTDAVDQSFEETMGDDFIETDQTVSVIECFEPSRPIPFTLPPEEADQAGLVFYLHEWFTECGLIKENELNILYANYGIEPDRVQKCIQSLLDSRCIFRTVDGYRSM